MLFGLGLLHRRALHGVEFGLHAKAEADLVVQLGIQEVAFGEEVLFHAVFGLPHRRNLFVQ